MALQAWSNVRSLRAAHVSSVKLAALSVLLEQIAVLGTISALVSTIQHRILIHCETARGLSGAWGGHSSGQGKKSEKNRRFSRYFRAQPASRG